MKEILENFAIEINKQDIELGNEVLKIVIYNKVPSLYIFQALQLTVWS